MKSIIRVMLLLSMIWPSVNPILASTHPPASNDRTIESKVDAYLKPFLDLHGFTGSILIAKGGQVLLSKGYGMANFELNSR